MITVTPQKMQKALIASIELVDPMKNAKQSVKEVIVMDGPACYIPRLMRFDGGKSSGTWSIALQITNISSTPMPKTKIGRADTSGVPFQP